MFNKIDDIAFELTVGDEERHLALDPELRDKICLVAEKMGLNKVQLEGMVADIIEDILWRYLCSEYIDDLEGFAKEYKREEV